MTDTVELNMTEPDDADNAYLDAQKVLDAIGYAVENEHIGVVQTTLKATGEKVNVLVAIVPCDGGRDIYPLAMLFNKSPFDLINPPDGGIVVTREDKNDAVI